MSRGHVNMYVILRPTLDLENLGTIETRGVGWLDLGLEGTSVACLGRTQRLQEALKAIKTSADAGRASPGLCSKA